MRKIESSIVKAINTRTTGDSVRLSNRDVVAVVTDNGNGRQVVQYKLHGHIVATITSYNDSTRILELDSCRHQTATAKSRMNAVLSSVLPGRRIYQKDFAWYVSFLDGSSIPFKDGLGFIF